MINGKEEFKVDGIYCKHSDDTYSLMFDIQDKPTSISAFCYSGGGMKSSIHITNINPQQMLEIADVITKIANEIIAKELNAAEVE